MKLRNTLVAICLMLLSVTTKAAYSDITIHPSNIVRVYDGDTFYITIPGALPVFGEELGIRTLGYDTPEIKSSCKTEVERVSERFMAEVSRDFLESQLMSAKEIVLSTPDRDKYFRLDANVLVDGVEVKDLMLLNKVALPYSGGTRPSWCGQSFPQ